MNNKRRTQLGQVASIAAPVLLIVGLRTLLAAGPSGAHAASGPVGIATAPLGSAAGTTAAEALTPQQQRVVDWRASLQLDATLRSPMDARIDVVLLPAPVPVAETGPVIPVVVADPLEGLSLTGTMGNQNAGLARISGKLYRVGDIVRPGFTLTSVDVRGGRIVLTADSGETFELIKPE